MKLPSSWALYCLALLHTAVAWDDPALDAFVNSIKTVDYSSRPHPDVSSPGVFDQSLKEWKERSKLYPAPRPSRCPKACSEVGPDPSQWAVFADMDRLKASNETLMFDVNVFNKLPDGLTRTSIRVCTADFDRASSSSKRDENASPEDPPVFEERVTSAIRLVSQGGKSGAQSTDGIAAASRQISNYISNKSNVNGSRPTIAFGSSGSSVMMALYVGHQARQQGIHDTLLETLFDEIEKNGASETIVMKLCDSGADRGADYIVGIAASTKGDFSFVQDAAGSWTKGSCLVEAETVENARAKAFAEIDLDVPDVSSNSSSSTKRKRTRHYRPAEKRQGGTCNTRQVVDTDSCAALAAKCGITPADFTKYNSYDKSLCSTLVPGQHVCCSSGDLPDMRPKPEKDGGCFVYTTKTDDTCSGLAAANSLKVTDIDDFNKKTWNFPGCKNLWVDIKICLSKGDPPMPAQVAEAKCGPTEMLIDLFDIRYRAQRGPNQAPSLPPERLLQHLGMAGASDWAIDLQSFEHDEYFDEDNYLNPLEKCDGSYDSIEKVSDDKNNIPGHCIEGYVVGALGKMLENALDEYDEIMDDGYDKKFGYFQNTVRRQWAVNMGDFFSNHIAEYFDCYRRRGDDLTEHACPPFNNSPGLSSRIVLKVKDEDDLKKFLLDEYDIDWENVEYDNKTSTDNGSGIGCNLGPCSMYFMEGVPSIKRNAEVPNPKDSVADSLSNLRKLPGLLSQSAKDISVLHTLDSESTPEDVVDGAMLPVFMVIIATDAMQEVADIGEELEEADRKWIIGMIVTAILFIIPAVGSAVSAVTGIAMIGRIAAIAAEVGGAVHGAIDIAENPDNAAAGIFAIVLSFVGVGSAVKGVWKDAAALRRGFKAIDLANLGGSVKTKVELVDSMVKVCRVKR